MRITYDRKTRLAEPHDYGLIDGVAKLLVYQRRDETQPAKPPGWRVLTVEQIAALEVLDETFPGSREDGQAHRFKWNPLFARVR